ncbi:MAG: hypothetical protein AAB394_01635 [Patescibacteria group bacterium]
MDTSNSAQTINDLYITPHREDACLGDKLWSVVEAVVRELLPVLRYIAAPRFLWKKDGSGAGYTCHCIKIGRNRLGANIYLDGNGGTFGTETEDDKEYVLSTHNTPYMLRSLPFEDLITSLQEMLQKAIEKRTQHLASLNERSQKLDEIMAILKR